MYVTNNYIFVLLSSFFESPDIIYNTRKKGQYDNKNQFYKDLACGLRGVRKELINIHLSAQSQQIVEYVNIICFIQKLMFKHLFFIRVEKVQITVKYSLLM